MAGPTTAQSYAAVAEFVKITGLLITGLLPI
jgi:hypothetical protein